jgi:hypothetical protein
VCKGDLSCNNGTCDCSRTTGQRCGMSTFCCDPLKGCTCCSGSSDWCPGGGVCLYGNLCGSPGKCLDPTTRVEIGNIQC